MKFKVKATKLGYMNHVRYREGDVLFIDESQMVQKSKIKNEEILKKRQYLKTEDGIEYVLPLWLEEIKEDYSPKEHKKSPQKIFASKEVL